MHRKRQGHSSFPAFYLLIALGLPLMAMPVRAAFPYVKKVSHTSQYLDTAGRADFLIYLPPGYETSNLRYSTVFYLHGSTDNAYTDTCQAAILDRLIVAKDVNPMIIVYLNVTHTGGYRDRGPGDMQESFIIQDIIPHIDKTYRTIGTPEGRALDGFSMGSAGSLRLGFTHPKLFAALMAWDGGHTTAAIAELAEKNVADIKGRMEVTMWSQPYTGQPIVAATLERLGVAYTYTPVNAGHVEVLGESGPSNNRKCVDPSRVTTGWKFFSRVLAKPSDATVTVEKSRDGQSVSFDNSNLADLRIYTPAGKYLGDISSRSQMPGKGLYLIQSKKFPARTKLAFFD